MSRTDTLCSPVALFCFHFVTQHIDSQDHFFAAQPHAHCVHPKQMRTPALHGKTQNSKSYSTDARTWHITTTSAHYCVCAFVRKEGLAFLLMLPFPREKRAVPRIRPAPAPRLAPNVLVAPRVPRLSDAGPELLVGLVGAEAKAELAQRASFSVSVYRAAWLRQPNTTTMNEAPPFVIPVHKQGPASFVKPCGHDNRVDTSPNQQCGVRWDLVPNGVHTSRTLGTRCVPF